jgi:hypothetical protein
MSGDLTQSFNPLIDIVGWQNPSSSVIQKIGRGRRVRGNYRQSAGHRFKQHQAEPFKEGRKNKHISRLVVTEQFLSRARAKPVYVFWQLASNPVQ